MKILTGDILDTWKNFYKSKSTDIFTKVPYDDVVRLFNHSAINEYSKKYGQKQKLLELGFGSGINLLHSAIQGYEVYGVDISEIAVSYAEKLFKENNHKANLYVTSTEKMPFENDFFDIIMESGLLVCLNQNQYMNTIKEITRILKKDGFCYISCYGDSDMRILNACTKTNDESMVKFNYKNEEVYLNTLSVNDVINIFRKDFTLIDLEKNIRIKYNLEQSISTYETIIWRMLFKKK